MKWPSPYRGWDDRRLPVGLAPTWWAPWLYRGSMAVMLALLALSVIAMYTGYWITPKVTTPMFLVVMAVSIGVGLHERFDRLVPTRLTLGLCPQCFYRLDNLDREEDNATVCPECGAAWVLPGKAKKG